MCLCLSLSAFVHSKTPMTNKDSEPGAVEVFKGRDNVGGKLLFKQPILETFPLVVTLDYI